MKITAVFSSYSSNDIVACREFYGEALGLELREEMDGIGFGANGQRVFIYPKSDHQPAKFTVLNFVVDSIDDAVDELVEKGVTFERYPDFPAKQDERGIVRGKDTGMGPDIAWFKDPSGNILALVEE